MVHDCWYWLVLTELFLQALVTSRGPDGGLRVAPDHGSLTRGDRAYGLWQQRRRMAGRREADPTKADRRPERARLWLMYPSGTQDNYSSFHES